MLAILVQVQGVLQSMQSLTSRHGWPQVVAWRATPTGDQANSRITHGGGVRGIADGYEATATCQ